MERGLIREGGGFLKQSSDKDIFGSCSVPFSNILQVGRFFNLFIAATRHSYAMFIPF